MHVLKSVPFALLLSGSLPSAALGAPSPGKTDAALPQNRPLAAASAAVSAQSQTGQGQPSGGGASTGTPGMTTISARKRLLLDPNGHEVTFWGDVQVVDARFSMGCEKLVVHLRKATLQSAKGEAAAGKPEEGKGGGSAGPGGEVTGEGAFEKAVAEGDVVIFQERLNEQGQMERRIGRARKAVYDVPSGLITLSGWPQIEHKASTIVAAEESTVFVLDKKGGFEVLGHSRSVLRNSSQGNVGNGR